jgi:hypothetical protein
MGTTANTKIALAALAAPMLAAIAVGLAAPAWAQSEQVEPQEPSEVGEAGMWTMPSEPQEQSFPSPNVVLPKPGNNATADQCTAAHSDPGQLPGAHTVLIDAFCVTGG